MATTTIAHAEMDAAIAETLIIDWLRKITDTAAGFVPDNVGSAGLDASEIASGADEDLYPEFAFFEGFAFGARVAIAVLANPLGCEREVRAAIADMRRSVAERAQVCRGDRALSLRVSLQDGAVVSSQDELAKSIADGIARVTKSQDAHQ